MPIRQPAIEPIGDSKPGWWIAKTLAAKCGLEGLFPWKNLEEYLAQTDPTNPKDYPGLRESSVFTIIQMLMED